MSNKRKMEVAWLILSLLTIIELVTIVRGLNR